MCCRPSAGAVDTGLPCLGFAGSQPSPLATFQATKDLV